LQSGDVAFLWRKRWIGVIKAPGQALEQIAAVTVLSRPATAGTQSVAIPQDDAYSRRLEN